jgi:spore germination cell wall hydrolase CwlJ-like protein
MSIFILVMNVVVQLLRYEPTLRNIPEVPPAPELGAPVTVGPAPALRIETAEKEEFTEEQLEHIVRVVIAEAGIEPFEGQCAVAQVIWDRLHHSNKKLYGRDLEEVLTKPYQFAAPYKGSIEKFPDTIAAVNKVFREGYRTFEEVTVIFFDPRYSTQASINLLRKYNYIATIGGHEFRGDIYGP